MCVPDGLLVGEGGDIVCLPDGLLVGEGWDIVCVPDGLLLGEGGDLGVNLTVCWWEKVRIL